MLYKRLFEDLPKEFEKDFGKDLFGTFRKTGEEDTTKEKNIFKKLQKWIIGDYMGGLTPKKNIKELETAFRELMKLKSYEPKVLMPEDNILFRGSAILKHKFPKLKKEDFQKTKISGVEIYLYNKQFSYTPKSPIQSWTNDFNIALEFVNQYKDEDEIGLIYKAEFPENSILFNHEFLNQIADKNISKKEDEIVHIGNDSLDCELILSIESFKKLFK